MGPLCVKDQVFCGTDGVSYASAKDLYLASCEKGVLIFSASPGLCNGEYLRTVLNSSRTASCRTRGRTLPYPHITLILCI